MEAETSELRGLYLMINSNTTVPLPIQQFRRIYGEVNISSEHNSYITEYLIRLELYPHQCPADILLLEISDC